MPTSARTRRLCSTFPVAGPGGSSEAGLARWWPSIVPLAGLLLAAGAVAVAFGPEAELVPYEPPTPVMTMPAVPFATVVSAGSTAGSVLGQSVVTPATGPGRPAPSPVVPALSVDAASVRAAEVRITTAEGGFREAFDRAASLAFTFGGFVASSTSSFDDDGSGGQLVLRVPEEHFDPARRAIAALGDVESETIRGQDVSAQLVDQEARQRSLEVQEETLRALVGRAVTVNEVMQIQPALNAVRQQIEQLRGQRAILEDAAELSSILVTLREPGAPAAQGRLDTPPTGLGRRVDQAVDATVAVIGGAIVVLGWALPALVLGAAGWLILARRRRVGRAAVGGR